MSPFLDDSFPEISGIWPEETEQSQKVVFYEKISKKPCGACADCGSTRGTKNIEEQGDK